MRKVAVIGGGASGLAAAISAARAGAEVTIYEQKDRVGQKILATGNGRCNLTNTAIVPEDYNAPYFVTGILSKYGPQEIRNWFAHLGLLTFEEREGRVYPLTNTATSVLDVLRLAVERLGVTVECNHPVSNLDEIDTDRHIVATGGGSGLLGKSGHVIEPFHPILCSLATDRKPIRGLSGIRARVQVNVYATGTTAGEPFASEYGEVLFRDYGLSGVVIFDMSRYAQPQDLISLDFLPGLNEDETLSLLEQHLDILVGESLTGDVPSYQELLCGMFQSRVADAILRMSGVKPSARVERDMLAKVAMACNDFRIEVAGVGDAKHAQVTRGGAAISEFDADTLESLVTPGVYACGEALDVDAKCGGYNLHWAWASGIVAGQAAASEE